MSTARFQHAQAIADAVLYEGYVLYPYHSAAPKNQYRLQWGIVAPPGATEPSRLRAECLLDIGMGRAPTLKSLHRHDSRRGDRQRVLERRRVWCRGRYALAKLAVPEHVRVRDYGTRGMHLAFDLLENNYELTVLVDVMIRGAPPGTVALLEQDLTPEATGPADAHVMTPAAVFRLLRSLSGTPSPVRVVTCEPETVEEGMGLSAAVEAAVPQAIIVIQSLISLKPNERI